MATGENLFSHQDARNLLRYGGMRPDRDWLQFDCALSYGLCAYLRTLEVIKIAGWSPRRCIPHKSNVEPSLLKNESRRPALPKHAREWDHRGASIYQLREANEMRNAVLARASLDLTAGTEIPRNCAISSMERSCPWLS